MEINMNYRFSLNPLIVPCLFGIIFFASDHVEAKNNGYSVCFKNKDVPKCLVTISAKSRWTTGSYLFEAVIKTGSIEFTKTRSKDLVLAAVETISSDDSIFKQLGIDFTQDAIQKEIGKSESSVILAAVALASAAQISDDPFSHPIVEELVAKANDSSAISVLAAKFWLELDVYGIWSSIVTRPPGLHKIWEKIVADPNLDEATLVELANSGGFSDQAREFAFPLYQRFESLQKASNESKAEIASSLARFYGFADRAEKLMESGGNKAKGYQITGVYAEIAVAKLKAGYEPKFAQILLKNLKEDTSINSSYWFYSGVEARNALQASNAKIELIELGKLYLVRADEEKRNAEDRANLYALASDCYLRAGDKEQAIKIARMGLRVVPDALQRRLNENERKKSKGNPNEQARLAQGFGTEPALALYRSGEISEALSSGYLTGFDRYRNAEFVGELPDPKWVIDYEWPIAISFMVRGAVDTKNENIRKNVYKEMMRWASNNPEFQKNYEVQEQLAVLAASIGDRSAMNLHLENYGKALDKDTKEEAAYFSLELAEQWLRDSRILHTLLSE